MIYYLTYNEPFNGIFNSQVIDVVKHLRVEHQQEIRLISFVQIGFNLDLFKKTKSQLKSTEPDCIVIPTLPVQYGWKFNWFFLLLVLLINKRGSVFSREIFASYLAIKCRKYGAVKKVCHDGRGCNLGQMLEYDIYSENIKRDIIKIEPFVINHANFRLSVSNKLVEYWRKNFLYQSTQHVVIPCTISEKYISHQFSRADGIEMRKEFGFSESDIILVFSGSNYGWQSLDLIKKFCEIQLSHDDSVKIVFLSKEDDIIIELTKKYNNRILCKWLTFDKVIPFLSICDYGILIRQSNDTNNVASPTKFGEYLASGLPVIISNNLEFAQLVQEESCGVLVNNNSIEPLSLQKIDSNEKNHIKNIALNYFVKTSELNREKYNKIIEALK